MVSLTALWLPILLSGVFVFVASSIIHMVLGYHKSDFKGLPDQDRVQEALRGFNIPPGDYFLPHADSLKESSTPEFIEKCKKGPVALLTVMKSEPVSMTGSLIYWFIYCLVVGVFAAYISGRALGPGAEYHSVFRFAGCTAFIGYSLALWQGAIWYKRSIATTLKNTVDGLIYGLLTGGVFGWLWP